MSAANQAEHEAWNGESGRRWTEDADGRDRVLAAVAEVLLGAAEPRTGERVLDIGCGCGATTLAAARLAAPAATLGIDISEPMLDVARQRATAAGLDNVTFSVADAQTERLDEGAHDLAISRFGTMFFDDPGAALANIARALRRGGRLVIATWQPLLANEWLVVPGAALLDFGELPESGGAGPGMFAQSDPALVVNLLDQAGFDHIDVQPITVPLRLGGDLDAATTHLADVGPGRAVLATIPETEHPAALAAVRASLADHVTDDGVHLGGAILLTSATRR